MAVSPLYVELIQAFDARRRGLGLSMAALNDLAGVEDGYFNKAVNPSTPSGRQAKWFVLDLLLAALWPDGARLAVIPANMPASERGPADLARPGPVFRCVYTAVLEQIDTRRRALGLTAADVDELAGVRPRGTLWRALLPEDDPQRVVEDWDTIDLWRQALWPAGARVALSSGAPTIRHASNDNSGQLALDLDVAGPHMTLTSWYARRRKPRKYTPGGCGRRAA